MLNDGELIEAVDQLEALSTQLRQIVVSLPAHRRSEFFCRMCEHAVKVAADLKPQRPGPESVIEVER